MVVYYPKKPQFERDLVDSPTVALIQVNLGEADSLGSRRT